MTDGESIREAVRRRYAQAARGVAVEGQQGCCGAGSSPAESETCCKPERDVITRDLYGEVELGEVPDAARLASLGCGNPTALAELRAGEVVLDLGSGGGIDVLLSARRVGPGGRVYGLDMTEEMLELARRNQREAGIDNVEFLEGTLEDIPLPDVSVDVIISNCVINLSTDKERVLREAYRVLRPGGRFAVADVMFQGSVPEAIRRSIEAWSGCLAGALHEEEYRRGLEAAGFEEVELEVTRVHEGEELQRLAAAYGIELDEAGLGDGRFCSAFIRARRPSSS